VGHRKKMPVPCNPAACHDILQFLARELATLGADGPGALE
jgi:hypothetical protein